MKWQVNKHINFINFYMCNIMKLKRNYAIYLD